MLLVVIIILGDIGRTDGVETEVVEWCPMTYCRIVGGDNSPMENESRCWIWTDGGWDSGEDLFGELEGLGR